jgi:hypothetical protein
MRNRSLTTATRCAALIFVCLVLFHVSVAHAGRHPRLLIKPDDIPRLKHACGVEALPADARSRRRFGEQGTEFNTLRFYFSQRLGNIVLPGEVLATAFLHLVSPEEPGDAARLALINNALTQPTVLVPDTLETVVALDWCWEALDTAARRDFLLEMRRTADPLSPADSPLDHRVFRGKLAALALALAVDEGDEPSPAWAALRGRILEAAERYFATTFPTYVAWRGLIPTGPAAAAFEENDTALAVELAGLLTGGSSWRDYRASVGRWMEHYVLASSVHPALQHQFLRDDGSAAPPTPAAKWDALLPVTAHLIAARTRDPAAACLADRVEAALQNPSADPRALLWCWVPLVFDVRDVPRADVTQLPYARRLDGAVVLRGGAEPGAAVIWLDAGQPFLRRGQHFDAGHFLIHADGHLVVEGGDDVEFEAIYSKGGLQRLGNEPSSFDFAQYLTATIAHNCMLFWDALRVPRWYGRLYAPAGGQMPLEGTCTDFATPLDRQPRRTAELLAYGYDGSAAYVALDLSSAYDPRTVEHYTREFLFLWGRVLLVIDRAKTANNRIIPTWVINVPSRPAVDGKELVAEARVAGTDNDGGVWRYDDGQWLCWRDVDGALWLQSLLPRPRRLAIVGGPARKLVIAEGPHKGQTYVGGDPDSFERLILPSGRPNAANAWYRLGKPTLLGPQFGIRPHWGRVEIEPASRDERHLFVTSMVIDKAEGTGAPDISVQETEQQITILLSLGPERGRIVLPTSEAIGGELRVETPEPRCWGFPSSVGSDEPLPVH